MPQPTSHPDQPRRDSSYKWIPPDPDYDQEVWDEQVRQYRWDHLRNERPKVRIQRLV